MYSELDKLSESLDKINCGKNPSVENEELSELLEIAALLHQADLPVQPPEHILNASVQRAADGLNSSPSFSRVTWMYSGLIGAAAAILLFIGLNGIPSIQETAQKAASLPSAAVSPLPQDNTVESPSAPASPPVAAEPESVAAPVTSQSQVASTPSAQYSTPMPVLRQAPATSVMKSATRLPAPAAPVALTLPGRTPDSVVFDPATGILRQFFNKGMPSELIVTQRTISQTESASNNPATRKASGNFNAISLTIDSQHVTLEGRQTTQELTLLAQTLTTNPK